MRPAAYGLLVMMALASAGCATQGLRAAITLRMERTKTTPANASVYIDEEYVAPLYIVQAHGIRLPVGEHRITVQKDGYFPYDRLVKAGREPIQLEVELTPIPD